VVDASHRSTTTGRVLGRLPQGHNQPFRTVLHLVRPASCDIDGHGVLEPAKRARKINFKGVGVWKVSYETIEISEQCWVTLGLENVNFG